MPFSENQVLKNLYRPGIVITSTDPQIERLRETPVEIYTCPSDLPMELVRPAGGCGNACQNVDWWPGSYHANSGRGNGAVTWYLTQELPLPWGTSTVGEYGSKPIHDGWRGPIHACRYINGRIVTNDAPGPEALKNISDGTSATLLAGESTNWQSGVAANPLGRRTMWALTWGNYMMSQTYNQDRTFWGDYPKCTNPPNTPRPPEYVGETAKVCLSGWFSGHTVGMNFVRCDGSMMFINFDTDMQVFALMGSIADEGVF
jgi:hypothetical protein